MKRILLITAIALFCGISAFAKNTGGTTETKEKTLYERLGGCLGQIYYTACR